MQQAAAPTVSHDRSTVEAVVRHYFDGLYEGDADRLGAVFHPSADLRWVEKGELQVLTVPDWLDRIRKRPVGVSQPRARLETVLSTTRSKRAIVAGSKTRFPSRVPPFR